MRMRSATAPPLLFSCFQNGLQAVKGGDWMGQQARDLYPDPTPIVPSSGGRVWPVLLCQFSLGLNGLQDKPRLLSD